MIGDVVWTLADISIRACVAAVLVAGALAAFRVRASAVRHASWTAVLVSMLLMPALVRTVPVIAVPMSLAVPALPLSADVDRREASSMSVRTASIDAASASVGSSFSIEPSDSALQRAPVSSRTPRVSWLLVTLALYAVGAFAMLLRFLVGWWGAARIAGSAERLSPPPDCLVLLPNRNIDMRESRAVTVPVTVGLMRQTILLPCEWRRWSREKLRAVLAHELAHVRRRDLIVAFTAYVNRCLFWFHPLSWWLERTLTATAEQAADEEAIAVLGDRRAYAEILLDMARAVASAGGRVSWLGVGIDGSGLLHRRIASALAGGAPRHASALRQSMVAVSCVSAILIAVACRPSPISIGEDASLEQHDRAFRLQLLQVSESRLGHFVGIDWDAESHALAARERELGQHPDDVNVLRQFLVSYWAQYACNAVADCGNPVVVNKVVDARLLAARRSLIVSLIDRHPESDLAGAVEALIFLKDLAPFFPADPAGYAQAKSAWTAQTRRPDVSAVVLGHAAEFFALEDKPLAEQMLLRARSLDPHGPWAARLGRFYRDALLGSMAIAGRNSLRTVSAGEPRPSFVMALREKLAKSTDEEVLTATGWFLSGSGKGPWMDVDPVAWAQSCLTRALQINPRAIVAHTALLQLREQMRNDEPLWRVAPASRDVYVATLAERQRFEELPRLARSAYRMVTEFDTLNDQNLRGRLELGRDQARRYAEDALKLAPKFRDDPDYGTAIYTANMTLSALALHDGDRKASVLYLQRASDAPSSERLAYGADVVWRQHVRDLVTRSERQAAIAYLERMAGTNIARRIDLRDWAAELRRGGQRSGPSFDAASTMVSRSTDHLFDRDPHARISRQSGGICSTWGWIQASDTCFNAERMTVRELVAFAFGPSGIVTPLPEIDGPAWIDADRFDIVARAAGTDPAEPVATPRLAMMTRTLLEERFDLVLHHESRPLPVYELFLAGSERQLGPRMRQSSPECVAFAERLRGALARTTPAPLPSPRDPCMSTGGHGYFTGGAVEMTQLVFMLSNRLGRIVRDRTGLAGVFAVDLTWEDPAISSALQEQLGLKLVAATDPVDVLVIDRVTAPHAN
jgi:uncharacterized protein (TIGR03435 family)